MKPQKLILCGWGPYKNKVEVDFEKFNGRGLFLITGPTGAGKTTLFDAISYALYGSLSGEIRDKEKNSVRSDFAEGDVPTYVELYMQHAGKTYRIVRNPEYMRPKKKGAKTNALTREKENAILYLPEDKVIEGTKEVNAYIKDLLALDYGQFKQLSMIAQGEFAKLLTAPPKDKTKIFREIFSTGVYERFTANLGVKAKAYYVRIQEQKNKLEEDIRLLAVGLEETAFEEGLKEEWNEALAAQNRNYEKIQNCLEEMQKSAKRELGIQEGAYHKAEEELEKANMLLTKAQEENKRILEYRRALENEERLEKMAPEFKKKEKQYQDAVNAGWVELEDLKYQQEEAKRSELVMRLKQFTQELEDKRKQRNALEEFWGCRERLQELIATLEQVEKKVVEKKRLDDILQKKEKQLAQEKKEYEEKEQESLTAKTVYEEALLIQKRAAIGLVASMLEMGIPCPVCGSTKHPNPAQVHGEVLSEQELEALKKEYEEKEERTRECYQQILVGQTQASQWREQLECCAREEAKLQKILDSEKNPFCEVFLSRGAAMAANSWQKNTEQYGRLQAIIQEKEAFLKQLALQEAQQVEVCAQAKAGFVQALSQYGFEQESDYRQACLDKKSREALGKSLEQYKQQRASSRQLLEHLKQIIRNEKPVDVEPMMMQIERLKKEKNTFLTRSKRWEQNLAEIQRTRKLCREKLSKIQEQSKEYGCIKELENIANGNNAKKLVFEQYVLAGYFEEILRAANVRFGKMTSGRYEMRRTKEVGDGRTKDNLEIVVMDYYTGKERSVRTLSGGESFKASLALALGLSDIIQAMSGGIHVDTLFIDEGFGALDSESLDQACNTLMSLVDNQRLIGIISHVPELRERITNQIIIEKSTGGSVLRIEEGV